MKKFKNTAIITSYVLLVALFFATGYAFGKRNTKIIGEPEAVPENVYTAAGEAIETPTYEVIYEDGEIKINKCIGTNKEKITGERISEKVFPDEDIEELKNGVVFERLETAQQMFENFVS